MSAAESPFSVKRWLASHGFRRLRPPHVTLSDTTPAIVWDQHDWPFHLGLYGPAGEIQAMQRHLSAQFLALGVPIFFIGPAESVDAWPAIQGLRFVGVEQTTSSAATALAVSLRSSLIPAQVGLPLQATFLFSPALALSFTRQLTRQLAPLGVSCIFGIAAQPDPHGPAGLLFDLPYEAALIWPGHAPAYEALTTQPLPDVPAQQLLYLRRRHHPQTFANPSPA